MERRNKLQKKEINNYTSQDIELAQQSKNEPFNQHKIKKKKL